MITVDFVLLARIEDYFLKYIGQYSDIAVEYSKVPESLNIEVEDVESFEAFPISVTVRHLPQEKPAESTELEVPNGLYRSNLTADTTNSVLAAAKDTNGSKVETIRAKYVVGCDGAHSWTRRQIGSVMEGEQADFIWSVT